MNQQNYLGQSWVFHISLSTQTTGTAGQNNHYVWSLLHWQPQLVTVQVDLEELPGPAAFKSPCGKTDIESTRSTEAEWRSGAMAIFMSSPACADGRKIWTNPLVLPARLCGAAAGNRAHCYIGKVCSLLLVRADYIRPRPRARPRGEWSSCYAESIMRRYYYVTVTTRKPLWVFQSRVAIFCYLARGTSA